MTSISALRMTAPGERRRLCAAVLSQSRTGGVEGEGPPEWW
jgi:hypothetical protein